LGGFETSAQTGYGIQQLTAMTDKSDTKVLQGATVRKTRLSSSADPLIILSTSADGHGVGLNETQSYANPEFCTIAGTPLRVKKGDFADPSGIGPLCPRNRTSGRSRPMSATGHEQTSFCRYTFMCRCHFHADPCATARERIEVAFLMIA
jgi:hypothetical protein